MKIEFPGILTVLFVIFLVLKLTGTITWSWWYVTLPLWIAPFLFLVIFSIEFSYVFFTIFLKFEKKL